MLVFVNSEISVIKLCPGPYLVPVRCFPSPYRSIHFGDVSKANGRKYFRLDHVTRNALAVWNNEA